MKTPTFNTKLFNQFIKDCQNCTAAHLEIKNPEMESDEVIPWKNILQCQMPDKGCTDIDNDACVFQEWSPNTYGSTLKIPFSSFMNYANPRFDGVSYILHCMIEKDPIVKITFLYPREKK